MARTDSLSLIGMPAAGKSTVGVLLAKQLGRPFIDTDICIQAGVGKTLQQIIAEKGLEAFARIEQQYVCDLDLDGHIVATGGSVIYSRPAMEHLSAAGSIVYLQLPLDELTERLDDLAARGVMIPDGVTLAELYAERCALYEQWADTTVDCRRLRHQELVDAIIRGLFWPSA